MSENDGRVISNFITQALANKDITIYGDGSQTRSFQYVTDLIEGIMRMIMTTANFTGPINIGNSDEYTILDLAKKVIDKTGSRSKIIFKNLPLDDPLVRCPNTKMLNDELKWFSKISLDDGLEKTEAYFKSIM